jgi:septal ring factor EnvC (AmiA/AmiB activator)
MNKLGKIAPIVVIVACLASLFFAFTLAGIKKDQAAKIADLDSTLNATKASLAKTETKLKQTETDLTKTKGDLEQASAILLTTKTALDQKTQEADGLKTQLTEKTQDLDKTKADLASAQDTLKKIKDGLESVGIKDISSVDNLRDKITSLGEENKVLGTQLGAMQTEIQQLKDKIEFLTTTPVGLRGRVSLVQGKWGFIVMDIGYTQRVRPNAEFLVYRDSKFIGKVQVVSVAAQNCIAQILPDYLNHPPQPGDLVVH